MLNSFYPTFRKNQVFFQKNRTVYNFFKIIVQFFEKYIFLGKYWANSRFFCKYSDKQRKPPSLKACVLFLHMRQQSQFFNFNRGTTPNHRRGANGVRAARHDRFRQTKWRPVPGFRGCQSGAGRLLRQTFPSSRCPVRWLLLQA